MKTRRLRFLLPAFALSTSLLGTCVQAADEELIRRVQNATVKLSVQHDKGKHLGYALIVGQRGRILDAVTARHLFCPSGTNDCELAEMAFTAEAWFLDGADDPVTAQRVYNNNELNRTGKELDLAHLTINLPGSHTVDFAFGHPLDRRPERETAAWIVGIDRGWDKSSAPFVVDYGADVNRPSGRDRVQFSGGPNPVIGGQSGAPLLTDEGVIGIVLEGSDRLRRSWALPLTYVRNATERAGIPWNVAQWEGPTESGDRETIEVKDRRGWMVRTGLVVLGLVAVGAYVRDASSSSAGDESSVPGPTVLTVPTL